MTYHLKMDSTFQRLSIPYRPDQQKEFESSLEQEGCRDPIVTWDGVILDGHKRFCFCRMEGIDYFEKQMSFRSESEAVQWICRNRIPQQEPHSAAYRYLIGKLYIAQQHLLKEGKKLPENEREICMKPGWNRISFAAAEEFHIHHATVENNGSYAKAMDQIAEKAPYLFEALLSGAVRMSLRETRKYAALNKEELRKACKERFHISERNTLDNPKRRRKKRKRPERKKEVVLSVGVKKMPAFDPDMELKGLTLTIPTWVMSINRAEKKTDMEIASVRAKKQLTEALMELQEQIRHTLEVINE